MAKLKSKSCSCFTDIAKHYFINNIPGGNINKNDQKLLQTCWWLIVSGFPQYVQMYKDDKLPVNINQLVDDHGFLNEDELDVLKKKVIWLNHLATKKLSIATSAYGKMTSVNEFQHCLSCHWTYDKPNCSWLRVLANVSSQLSRASTKESLSSLPSTSSSSSSSSSSTMSSIPKSVVIERIISYEDKVPHVSNCQSTPNDNNSLHMTSGYESEASPMSTNVFLRNSKCRPSLFPQKGAGSASNNNVSPNGVTFPTTVTCSTQTPLSSCDSFKCFHHDMPNEATRREGIGKRTSEYVRNLFHSNDNIIPSRCSNLPSYNEDVYSQSYPLSRRSGCYDNIPMSDRSPGQSKDNAQLELDLILREFYKEIGECDVSDNNINEVGDTNENEQQSQQNFPSQDDQVFGNNQDDTKPLSPRNVVDMSPLNHKLRSTEDHCIEMKQLSASQFVVMKKLGILKLSGILERSNLQSDFLNCLESIHKKKDFPLPLQERKLFGVHPSQHLKRTGNYLPRSISSLMDFIERMSPDSVGIFRKPGVQSRIQSLQKHIDLNPDEKVDVTMDLDPYDAADVFKRYLRDLPDSLFTENLCSAFSLVLSSLPSSHHMECLQNLLLLLPDVNRSILCTVFHFLHRVSQHSSLNQMTPSNLAVCFLPSLFRMNESSSTSYSGPTTSTFNNPHVLQKHGTKSDSNVLSSTVLIWDHKSALACLTFLIEKPQMSFSVSKSTIETVNNIINCLSSCSVAEESVKNLSLAHKDSSDSISNFLFSSMKNFNMFRGWNQIKIKGFSDSSISISSEQSIAFVPSWKCQVEVLAPPIEVLNKIHKDSQPWVGFSSNQRTVENKIIEGDKINSEITTYGFLLPSSLITEESSCTKQFGNTKTRITSEIRAWKTDLPKESCFYCSKSVGTDGNKNNIQDDETGKPRKINLMESNFFLEPCGEGHTSLTHIATVDLMGHSTDWYDAAFPPILSCYFRNLRQFFNEKITNTSGPETKV